jgi:hypothetical protein
MDNVDGTQQECMLIPRKAFINSSAHLFRKFFITEPIDKGNANQKVLINYMQWKTIEQSGNLIYDATTKEISGVSWQNIDREEVKKEFRDECSVCFSDSSMLEMYLFVLLGGGDTEWVACALGKENMAGAHCNQRFSSRTPRTLDADSKITGCLLKLFTVLLKQHFAETSFLLKLKKLVLFLKNQF